MTNIDDKLRQLSFHNPGVTRWLKLSDADIAQIKQVFAEEIQPILAKQTDCIQDIIDNNNLMANTVLLPNVMTGQEWYDRFEKIVKEDTEHFKVEPYVRKEHLPDFIENKVLEAAKKAAGLDNE